MLYPRVFARLFRLGWVALLCLVSVHGAEVIIDEDAEWRALPGTQEASSPDPTAWRELGFNDAFWPLAQAPFYYDTGTGYTGNTELTDMLANYSCLFLRKTFRIDATPLPAELTLDVRIDDGCVVWINGVEVLRVNVRDGEIPHDGTSLPASGEPNVAGIRIQNTDSILLSGDNVIAIQALNSSLSGSSDFLIAAALGSDEDVVRPELVDVAPRANARVRSLTEIEVVFSESVQGVDAADLLIGGGPATGLSVYSPRNYLFTFAEPPVGVVEVDWASGHGITDLAPNPNPFIGEPWQYDLDPTAPPEVVLISEFLADNDNGIRDEDGDRSDWIELYNSSDTAVNLAGWSLTDDPDRLNPWMFPSVTLGSGDYLLVWASGKGLNGPTPFHTDFRLSAGGEYLALFDPLGNLVDGFSPVYPPQQPDISYGTDIVDPSVAGYFPIPTPGEPNVPGGPGFAPTPEVSVAEGIYTDPTITVTLSAPSGQIRYTTDGTTPAADSSLYTAPLQLSTSTLLQVRTFEPGLLPSPVISRTYTMAGTSVAAFSSNLPLLIIHTAGRWIPENTRIPAAVVALDTWRGRASLNVTPQWQGRAEVEVRGQTSAGFPKKPYNLELNDPYGQDLEVPLLGMPAESDWALHNPYSDKSLLNNFLTYEMHEKMGHYAVRRRYVELFVDQSGGRLEYPGDYAGVYVLLEKIKVDNNRVDLARLTPQNDSEPEISGGYIIKKDKSSPGDRIFYTQGGSGFGGQEFRIHEPKPDEISNAQYDWIRDYMNRLEQALYATDWKTATGENHYSHYIDVDSFVDNHWIVEFTKQIDGYRLSNYLSKDRGGKLRMEPIWDWNLSLGNANYYGGDSTSGWYWDQLDATAHLYLRRLMTGTTSSSGTSGDPEFLQRIIDRWGELRSTVMAGTNVVARIDEIAALLSEAQAREFQRWPRLGTYVWPNPQYFVTPTTHQGIIAAQKSWVLNRFAWIDDQYPVPPEIHSPGLYVTPGITFSLSSQERYIYYTVDGSDPRRPGGGVSGLARVYSEPVTLDQNSQIVARVRRVSLWGGPTSAAVLTSPSPLRITELLFRAGPGFPGDTNATDTLEFLELCNHGPQTLSLDGYALTDGVRFSFATGAVSSLPPGGRVVVVRDVDAFTNRYGAAITLAGQYEGALDNNGERLTLTGPFGETVQSFRYDADWHPAADGLGFSLVPTEVGDALTDWDSRAAWRPSTQYGGSPGAPDEAAPPAFPGLLVTEALTHTDLPDVDYIEVHNPGTTEVSLDGWWLSDDPRTPKYRIPADRRIPAGGYALFTEADFNATPDDPNRFNLRSSGDEVFLFTADASGQPTGYRHGFEFGAALNGIAFGRHVNTEGRELFVSASVNTPGAPNAVPRVGPVVISEIHYHPPDVRTNGAAWNNSEDEFVELHNVSDAAVPLYDPQALTNSWQLRDAVRYTFPTNVTLGLDERVLVLAFDPTADPAATAQFRARFGVSRTVRLFGPFDGELANSGESVELTQPDIVRFYETNVVITAVLIDRVRYRDRAPWPSGADGLSYSLQKSDELAFGDEPTAWVAAAPTPGSALGAGETPVISEQPVSQSVSAGSDVTFTVQAAGPSPLYYQWRHNESILLGAVGPTLALSSVHPDAAGRYDVIVGSTDRAAHSTSALLVVTEPPLIHEQPQSVSVPAGEEVTFSVVASSMEPMQFQWRLNGTPLPGTDQPTLHFPAGSAPSTGLYDVVIQSFSGSVTSAPAQFSLAGEPLIGQSPVSVRAPVGGQATFGVRLQPHAIPPFSYTWFHNSVPVAEHLSDSRTDFHTLDNLQSADAGTVLVTVTDAAVQSDTSPTATLTVLTDTDGDGLPDEYEEPRSFLSPTDLGDAGLDEDGDGASNLEEYLAGTDPSEFGSRLRLEAIPEAANLHLRFDGNANRAYGIQFRDRVDDGAWQILQTFPATSSQDDLSTTLEEVDADALLSPQRYYRVITPP